ncbi:MAG TPA: hypothetical protein VGJ22_02290 [Anaerolineales bacterium]
MRCFSPLTRSASHALLSSAALLVSGLACQAFTDLLLPPATAVGGADSSIPTSVPSLVPTVQGNATCPDLTADILKAANYGSSTGDDLGATQGSSHEATYLTTYLVLGDHIGTPFLESVPAEFQDEQADAQAQQRTWDYFTALIPADQRRMLTAYVVITDGRDDILGAVTQVRSPDRWALEIDIKDAEDPYDLTYTLLHEFAHLLTLNADQVTPSLAVFNSPEDADVFEREAAACPRYFPGEGCSQPGSYLNTFYEQFWTDLYAQWSAIDQEPDLDTYQERLREFYRKHRDRFVSEYAATSPEEDIAETWAYFVLSRKPNGDHKSEDKILFFYKYPELMRLREQILSNLCTNFPE